MNEENNAGASENLTACKVYLRLCDVLSFDISILRTRLRKTYARSSVHSPRIALISLENRSDFASSHAIEEIFLFRDRCYIRLLKIFYNLLSA